MEKLLRDLRACESAIDWAKNKTWEEIYISCHRGDWLLWLFCRTNPKSVRELSLAKGHCARTVIKLMKDKRSISAVQAAIDFGNNKITKNELAYASAAASASAASAYASAACAYAAYAAYASAAAASAYAAYAAYASAAYAADASYADSAAYAAYAADAAYADKIKNQKKTADICRKYLPFELWNINR